MSIPYTVVYSVDILETITGNYPRYQNSQFTLPKFPDERVESCNSVSM